MQTPPGQCRPRVQLAWARVEECPRGFPGTVCSCYIARASGVGERSTPSRASRGVILPFVYILRCRDGSFYTGAATDLAARVRQHEKGRGSRYTRSRRPVSLAWSRRVRTWKAALREERRIKRLRRPDKEALVRGGKGAGA